MAKEEHLKILKKGVETWNQWRTENRLLGLMPDLMEADLKRADLRGARLGTANLIGADLRGAEFVAAMFLNANLSGADLSGAFGLNANLSGADLSGANLSNANLGSAILSGADLSGASLSLAVMVRSNLKNAKLTNCNIYGISAWDVECDETTEQRDLIITDYNQSSKIYVDDLEVAQFIYLLLGNKKIRNVLDTIGKKGVLILGRFTEERKVVLDAIRNKLRELGFVPMLFDFEKPTQRDFTETIKTLAGLSLFIIADITNPKSSPLELQATIPDYMIPFVPICDENEKPFSMFQDLQNKYSWVLDILEYDSSANLIKVMEDAVVKPALEKADQLQLKKAEAIRKKHVKDFLK